MSLPFRPLGNRVVIKADREDHAPVQTESGVLLATTLAAAVDGSDAEDSWFVGTVIAVGPLVNRFEIRDYFRVRVGEMRVFTFSSAELAALPAECPDPIRVGDRVAFSWASGQELAIDGEKFLIMAASDILAVLEEESVHA